MKKVINFIKSCFAVIEQDDYSPTIGKFEIFKSKEDKQWYFHYKSGGNNKIMLHSEGYKNRRDAENAIFVLKEDVVESPIIYI